MFFSEKNEKKEFLRNKSFSPHTKRKEKKIEVQVHPILRMGYVLLHLLRFFVP